MSAQLIEREPLLAALERRLSAVEARLAALESRRRPRADTARDERLLSAIAAAFGSAIFSAADLRAAGHDRELAAALGGVTVRALGAWLRRLHRTHGMPYRLQRVGRDAQGAVWALDASAD